MSIPEITVGIILGHGIDPGGALPALIHQRIKKAVELYQADVIQKLIFSGKWSWRYSYTPPLTEAAAGKNIAVSRGIPESDIFIEEESTSTISNLFLLEEKILVPQGFHKLLFLTESPLESRLKLNTDKLLGESYEINFIDSGYSYSSDELPEVQKKEEEKYSYTKNLFDRFNNLSHVKIYETIMKDLAENFIDKIDG